MTDGLFDLIEAVGEFTKLDQLTVPDPQKIRDPETQRPIGRPLLEADIGHQCGAVAIHEQDFDRVPFQGIAFDDAAIACKTAARPRRNPANGKISTGP